MWETAILAGLLVIVIAMLVILIRRGARGGVDAFKADLLCLERGQERAERAIRDEIAKNREETGGSAHKFREEVNGILNNFNINVEKKLEMLRTTIDEKLRSLQEDNARKLDQMRATVDEKLQGTLEKRLGESFKLVSERLEQVHKGLGEMQNLATGVGDLKRVLTNVKTRGNWGEVQLEALLEQVLAPDQYERNVATKEGREAVEFAIRLPGRSQHRDEVVWLPIDAKCPQEDYQRLIDAQERADVEAAEVSARQLELRVKACAKDIHDKYINPPKTTDFAIMFLPTEGLYAEIVRRPGLTECIQRDYRIVIAGPTTLWALLNSLQMGFRTLAIEKRSSEVWNLLGGIKTEFGKFGVILDGVKKKLNEASNNIDKAASKSRTIERKLRNVQELPDSDVQSLLPIGLEPPTDLEESDSPLLR